MGIFVIIYISCIVFAMGMLALDYFTKRQFNPLDRVVILTTLSALILLALYVNHGVIEKATTNRITCVEEENKVAP